MDQISRNLELAKGNAFLIHEVFNDLEKVLEQKLTEVGSEHIQSSDLKFLWDKCCHTDYAVALEACQSVVNLTLNERLGIGESVSSLLSCISTAKHFGILTDSVTELVIRGKLCFGSRHHPFITMLEMEPKTWPHILQQMSMLVSCRSFDQQVLKQFKSFIIYALCYGSPEVRLSLWNLLIGKLNNVRNQLIIDWLMESLLWQQNFDENQCVMYLTGVQQMCEYAIADRNEDLGKVTATLLVSAMQICHCKFGFSVNQSMRLVKELNNNFSLWLEPIVIILSQFILECQANCFEPVLELCQHFLKKQCNPYVWSMLQVAVLSVYSYSPEIESSVFLIVESFPNQVCTAKMDVLSNKYFQYLSRSQVVVKVALATAEIAGELNEEFTQFCALEEESMMPDAIFLLKCAIFWRHNELAALRSTVQHAASNHKFANSLLTVLLKKLTHPSSGEIKLAILYSLPAIAVEKSCVPRVLQILEALSASADLQPVRIKLLAELWQREDRVYRYLEKMICSDDVHSEEFIIAKASVIETVCSLKAEKYGPDLLAAISGLLNSSLVQANLNSGTIAALALNSLISLCKAEVVDLKSVWDILAPKLNQDHRPLVVTGVCNLLALSPLLRNDTEEYDVFINQAITILFRISLKSEQPDVAETALKSLSRFKKEDFNLTLMPSACKEDLKIPSKYLAANAEAATIRAEDVMDHVPGICWLKLMDCYEAQVLEKGFHALLFQLVNEEIQNMPIWIYRKAAADAVKKNEPTSYNSTLKEDSVLAALMNYVLRICETSASNSLRTSIALKVLAGPFERALPPFDWTVLDPIVQQYNLREDFLRIVFQQVPHSYSAQVIAEQVLTSEPLNVSWAKVALSYLGPLSHGLKSKVVENFICQFINENQSDCGSILDHLDCSLAKDGIQADVKQKISICLMSLLPILPEDAGTMRQFSHCFRLLSLTDFPAESSRSSAGKCVKILCVASSQSKSNVALNYLQKALQTSFYLPSLNEEILELVQKCVAMHCKSAPAFLQQFMSYIQSVAMKDFNAIKEPVNFSCLMDVFCLVLSSLSDSLCFRQRSDENCLELQQAWKYFPLSLGLLLAKPAWTTIKKCMLDWILVMMENQHVTSEQKQVLFNALTSIDIVNKEMFSKIYQINLRSELQYI